MAKKKPAAKMAKKPAAKKSAPVKKPVAKAATKKAAPMAKKAPVKKAPAKKVAPKKVVAKKTAPKAAAKPAANKSLASKVIKGASKILAKVTTKQPTKEQLKAQKEKEKALLAKEKAKADADKKKQKELEKKQKEQLKAKEKADKEALKAKEKADKLKGKGKKSQGEDEEDVFGASSSKARSDEDDDFDEFEEDYKKSKASKKSGKKAYDSDEVQVDIFEGKPSKKYKNADLADIEGNIADEIAQLREHFNWKEIAEAIGSMDFFIDPKNDECIEKGCDNIRTTQSYCRLHYLRNWKTVQKKRDILKEGKLQEYIEELISKYPPKFIEALLSDLSDDKEFYRVLNELNITSEFDFEEDEFENAVDDDDSDDDIGIETISSSLRYEDE